MKWAEHFGISEGQITKWKRVLPTNMDLLLWCMETHNLKEEDYFKWAQKHYKLPFLKTSFFKSHKVDIPWLQSVQALFAQRQNMAPLFEWKGKMFVACLEPLEEIPWDKPTQWILTSSKDLQAYKTYLKGLITSEEAATPKNQGTFQKELKPYIVPDKYEKEDLFDKLMSQTFKDLKKHFEKALFLAYDSQSQLKLLRCDERWGLYDLEGFQAISLDKPSVFQILHKTKKPFYGIVYPSEENERFFKCWGFKDLPTHLTAVPAFLNMEMTQVLGFFICTSDTNLSESTQPLKFAKQISQQFTEAILTQKRKIEKEAA